MTDTETHANTVMTLAAELRAALDDPKRYEWGEGPWEHLGDAEKDVRLLLEGISWLVARITELEQERDEAQRKQEIDERQCDEMTARAGASEARITELEQERDEARETLALHESNETRRAEAAEARANTLTEAMDGLYEAHGCRGTMGDRDPVGEFSTCGECAAALDALAAVTTQEPA